MTDNTTLNPGLGGDTVRSLDRSGTKTQVMALDVGGAAGESLVDKDTPLPAQPVTFNKVLRESFEVWPNSNWNTISSGSAGDLVLLDGNAVGASYVTISKDPFDLGSEVVIETTARFTLPLDVTFGLSMSQRTIGQEFVIDVVSDEVVTPPAELAISSISQATTTLTVVTATPHGLKPGMRIGIYGCTDSRMNYPSLVVLALISATSFTANATPAGTIASVTAGPFTSGFVYQRAALGYAADGSSMVFENGTATNASFYARNDGGDETPVGGTLAGNHSVNIGSTNSIQAIASALTYAMRPSNEWRLTLLQDRVQWQDIGVDLLSQPNARATMSQVVPDPAKSYKIRVRAKNNKGLPVPIAQIVSATKAGSTTATLVFDRAHGLTTADIITIRGLRDQTNFANTGSIAVASVIDATTITAAFGISATATSYGGFVNRVQGGTDVQGVITSGVIQSVKVTAANVLNATGSAAWSGFSIGDYVNLIGVRDSTVGASVAGIDGAYRVRNIVTTSVELEPIDGRTLSAGALVNCGGVVVRRTDLRLSFIRLFDFERVRVEMMNRPATDAYAGLPVTIQNNSALSLAASAALIGNVGLAVPTIVADVGSAAITSTTTSSTITPSAGTEYEVQVLVPTVSGTTPTLDVVIQESDDSGSTWFDVYHFPRIIAGSATPLRSPKIAMKGNRLRYVQTVSGTTPSFTRTINRIQGHSGAATPQRRIFDRSLNATQTLAANTASFNAQECHNFQLVINAGTITTTAPALKLVGSDDGGATWYDLGVPLTAITGTSVQQTLTNINAELVRATVTTAGVAAALNWIEIKAF